MTPEDYQYFLLAGGVLTLSDWMRLTDDEKLACIQGGDLVRRRNLTDLCTSLINPEKVLDVLEGRVEPTESDEEFAGDLDDLKRRVAVRAALKEACAGMQAGGQG